MRKAKTICTYYGCNTLISEGHRCDAHPYESLREQLDSKKTSEAKGFYSSSKWKRASISHRKREPLCVKCKENNRVTVGTLVHHNPERGGLIAAGLDPFDPKYLETLCFNCHQGELVAKRRG